MPLANKKTTKLHTSMSFENKALSSCESTSSFGGGLSAKRLKYSQVSFVFLSRMGSSTSGGLEAALFLVLDLVSAVLATGPAKDVVLVAAELFATAFEGFLAFEDVVADRFLGGMVSKRVLSL